LEGKFRLICSPKSMVRSTSDLKKAEKADEEYLSVERIRLENIDIRFLSFIFMVAIKTIVRHLNITFFFLPNELSGRNY
jgi:hypothetical protein